MGKLRDYYHKLLLSHASPHEVAQGFAMGVFIAMTPTMGFQTLIAIALAAYLKKNELAAIIGCWVTNPLTAFPIYYFNFRVGQVLMGSPKIDLREEKLSDIFNLGADILIPLWIGCLIIGLISAALGYWLALRLFPYLKRKREALANKIHQHGAGNA